MLLAFIRTGDKLFNDGGKFGIGQLPNVAKFLNFDITNAEIIRSLGWSEMEYVEPGNIRMIMAALKRDRYK